MTKSELGKILARCNKAQSGPWKAFVEGRNHTSGSDFIMTGVGSNRGDDIELSSATISDYDFIASARQDVPNLVNEVLRLKNLLKEK